MHILGDEGAVKACHFVDLHEGAIALRQQAIVKQKDLHIVVKGVEDGVVGDALVLV